MPLSKLEIIKAGGILLGALVFMWAVLIRPHSFEWEAAGETTANVKSLMSNTTVIGQPHVKAVVILDNGQQILVAVPTQSDVRSGDIIELQIQSDADKPTRKKYVYIGKP